MDFARFLRNALLWAVPVTFVWLLLLPVYNRFLVEATGNLLKIAESPNRTSVQEFDRHHLVVHRTDVRLSTSTGHVGSIRVTDVHFPLLFTAAIFLAVPGVPLRQRLENLGWALLISVGFHLLTLYFWVHFILATQLGDWSRETFSTFAQNFWGLGKHLLALPFKFGLPLALWMAFYFDRLAPAPEE